jgi:hypothetical protein
MWRWRVEHVLAWGIAVAAILCPRALWDRARLPVALAFERAAAGAPGRSGAAEAESPDAEAERLRAELVLVRGELLRVKAQRAELSRLLAQATAFAGAVGTARPVRALPVRVFGAEEAGAAQGARAGRVRIDAGSAHGVAVPAPLVRGAALAGRTTGVSSEAAEVELVTAATFRARCRNLRTDAEGIARGAGPGLLRFRPDGAAPDVREGDEIVTSAWSSFSPGALAVGTVTAIDRDPETGLVEARLAPAADLARLEEALVVLPGAAGAGGGGGAP